MAAKSHGRGAVLVSGVLLLVAGVAGAVVLWALAAREPDRAADSFARAVPGCRTTLSFAESGEFFVYEERSGMVVAEGCDPTVEPDQPFEWSIVDAAGTEIESVEDRSVTYDLDVGTGTSVSRITIDQAGDYEIEVRGSDAAVVAAIGGDPDENVGRLRLAGLAAAVIGVVVGGLLIWLSRRGTRDEGVPPEGAPADWPPRPPSLDGLSLTVPEPEPAPMSTSPWAPPVVGEGPGSDVEVPAPPPGAQPPADDD